MYGYMGVGVWGGLCVGVGCVGSVCEYGDGGVYVECVYLRD